MSLTSEQRQQLLEGDEKRGARQLPKMGYGDATTAPTWAQDIIIAVREAALSHGEFRMTPQQIADREQRSAVAAAALRTVTHLFPTKTTRPAVAPKNEMDVLRSIAHRQAAEIRADALVLALARREADEKRAAEELAESVAAFNAATFPWRN